MQKNNCTQHSVQTTWVDDKDIVFLLHFTNFLTADTAAGGSHPSVSNSQPLGIINTSSMKSYWMIKNKQIFTILILLGICIIFTIMSLLLNCSIKNIINEVFGWISGVSTLITLAIALMLFEKYGLNKKIEDKKQNVVLELLDELSKSVLILETNIDNGRIITSYALASGVRFENRLDFDEKELVFSKNYTTNISKISKYSKNYWMPKPIVKKIDDACFFVLTFNENIDYFNEKYVRIKFSEDNNYHNDKNVKYGNMNLSGNFNFEIYIQKWVDLHDAIISWLNENADFKLNP